MRVGGTVYYTLSDHIGSTSITLNNSGTKTAEMRYKAWGEVRYDDGNLQTDRTYTGQRTYTDDFGLMFYNARWYDTSIGHFAQADNIPLQVGDTQSLDRFAYVSNNPINLIDPTGHEQVCVDQWDSQQSKVVKKCDEKDPEEEETEDTETDYTSLYRRCQKGVSGQDEAAECLDLSWNLITSGVSWMVSPFWSAIAMVQLPLPPGAQPSTATPFIVVGPTGGGGLKLPFTCKNCGTFKPDLVRRSGSLRIDPDGASVWCRTCVKAGNTRLDPNEKYWIHSFDEFQEQAKLTGVPGPSYTGSKSNPGHFSVFAGATGKIWETLNAWIRNTKTTP